MGLFEAIIIAVVEGITEFLPISSTGHMIIASYLLDLKQTEFLKSFEIIIQFGAILSIIFLYFKRIIKEKRLIASSIIGFLPSAFFGVLAYPFIKEFLIGNLQVTLISLFAGGIILLFIDKMPTKSTLGLSDLSHKKAFMIGFFQIISFIPGVSRSAATIIGGLFLGLNKKDAVEFSFFLAVPTMFAASSYDLYKSHSILNSENIPVLLVGFITSFVVATFAVKWFVGFVENKSLKFFGFYRIIISLILAFFMFWS